MFHWEGKGTWNCAANLCACVMRYPVLSYHIIYHIISYHIVSVQVDKMVEEMLSETQCDSCFETATSARTLNGVCIVSPAVVHCVDCDQNLCASCCNRLCKRQSTQADVCNLLWHYSTVNLVAIRRIIGIQIHRLVYNILLTIFWRN